MYKLILRICKEYLHRTPSECGHIPMSEIWDLIVLAEEESEKMEQARGDS